MTKLAESDFTYVIHAGYLPFAIEPLLNRFIAILR